MYSKPELEAAIEAANENIARHQKTRKYLSQICDLYEDVESDIAFANESLDFDRAKKEISELNALIEESKQNRKRYKKMLALVSKMESMSEEVSEV